MIVLSPETISQVDAHALAYAQEHWNPSSKEGVENRARLELVATDLNLLDQPTIGSDSAALPGRDEAMYAVLSHLALQASDLMGKAPQSELHGMRLVDPSIALDPVRFDDTEEEKAAAVGRRAQERADKLRFHGSPAPSLMDRGPLPEGMADRVSETAKRVVEGAGWKVGAGRRMFYDAQMHVDRMQRLERNRKDVADPDLRAAYDLLHNDHAVKAANVISRAVAAGELKTRSIDWQDLRLLRDPHTPAREGGLSQQASGLSAEAAVASKGPQRPEIPVPVRSGAER